MLMDSDLHAMAGPLSVLKQQVIPSALLQSLRSFRQQLLACSSLQLHPAMQQVRMCIVHAYWHAEQLSC